MANETQKENNDVLTLPWDRRPNYLICVVALINLIAGVLTVRVAIRFAVEIASFNDVVAAVSIGLFGLMLVWVAWCFRKGVLPVRFVADAARRECGFRWGRWWNGRFDLNGAEKLIGELRLRKEKWQWAILLPVCQSDIGEQWIYGPRKSSEAKRDSEVECEQVIQRLAVHLSLPYELRTQIGGDPRRDLA